MTSSRTHRSATVGNAPAAVAMRRAKELITQMMERDLPAGAVADTLEVIRQLWDLMDAATLPLLLRAAQIHASGHLAEVGGQPSLTKWITHALRVPQSEAYALALLAQLLHEEKLPHTRKALDSGMLSVGEAGAVAKAAEWATKNRDKRKFADADHFRAMMETGIIAAKNADPTLSANEIARTGRDVAAALNPDKVEDDHKKAYDARRADLARTFEGSYYFQAWGPDADAELLEKAVSAYIKPHDANQPHVSKAERVYDAFIAMIKAALGHQECAHAPSPLAMINITVPLDVFNGQRKANAEEAARRAQQRDGETDQGAQDQSEAGGGFAVTQDGQIMAMEAVRRLAPDSVLRRVITDPHDGKPLDVGHGVRSAPEQIRTAANHGHTTCAWPQGCAVPISDTEADHIRSHSRGGTTSADNIQPLCSFHNRLKYRREKNPHRARWKGRPEHHPPPDPDPPPEPSLGTPQVAPDPPLRE